MTHRKPRPTSAVQEINANGVTGILFRMEQFGRTRLAGCTAPDGDRIATVSRHGHGGRVLGAQSAFAPEDRPGAGIISLKMIWTAVGVVDCV
jgi:hypothetical protein